MRSLGDLGRRLRLALEGPDGPALAWSFRRYQPGQLPGDLAAGLSLAAVIAPLSIGFAGVAGLPPEIGLYAAIGALLGYAAFGSGRRLVVGPDAAGAAIIAAALPAAASSDDRVRLASVLALLVAGLFVAMRVARVGFLADFLSRPILVGYLTGVGITVAIGQLPTILGGAALQSALDVLARVDWSSADPAAVADATRQAIRTSGANLPSLFVGGAVVAAIVLGRRVAPRVPVALIAVVVAIAASFALGLQSEGVRVLGPVQPGLPPLGIPLAQPAEVFALLPGAVAIAILSFTDSAVTARAVAARTGERADANRELVGMAAADGAAAVVSGYPISMSLTRTNESEAAGSTSQMAGVLTAAAIAVLLALLTGPLSYLPMPALGAVIFASVLVLIDVRQMRLLWRTDRSEGAIAVVAAGGVIVYGTLAGVMVAVLLAALNIVRRAAAPPIVEEVRMPEGTWRDATRRPDGNRVHGAVVVRLAGPMFFANAALLQARVRALVAARPDASAVVLDFGATAGVDVTAAAALRDLAAELDREGRRLAVARPLGNVRDELRGHGLSDLLEPVAEGHWAIDAVLDSLGLDPTRSLDASPPRVVAPDPEPEPEPLPPPPAGPGERGIALRVLAATAAVVLASGLAGVVIANLRGTPTEGTAPVPNLLGMSLDRATTAATDAGFELITPIYVQRSIPEGTVVGQNPSPGTLAERGSEVQPVVSTGWELVDIPDVTGLAESQAINILTSAGLQVSRQGTQPDDEIPVGAVLSTDPVAGMRVLVGSTVRYVVSAGPALEASPEPTLEPTTPAPPSATPEPTPVVTSTPVPTATAGPTPESPPPPTATPAPVESPSGEPAPSDVVPASS